ncbi:MAG: YczE/YyaS/YitT family protein [Tissierella sp.]|uniref:YczE/YyaS/YitT family protein n=1 Tax=Tissierella sp. TaxID=41274 RepID=UPI003F965000
MEKNKSSFLKKLLILTFGVTIMSFGISLYLKAGFGTDPITTFTNGSSIFLNISIGRASQLTMSIILAIIFFIDKKRIGLGAFFNTFLTGELLNMFMRLPMESSDLFIRSLLLAAGIVSFGFGVALFIISDLGAGPVDIIMSMIVDKFKISLQKSRIILDIILVIVGYLLGAPLGVGTILGVLLTGTVIAKTLEFEENFQILKVNKI